MNKEVISESQQGGGNGERYLYNPAQKGKEE